jgi:hypothetical protein
VIKNRNTYKKIKQLKKKLYIQQFLEEAASYSPLATNMSSMENKDRMALWLRTSLTDC